MSYIKGHLILNVYPLYIIIFTLDKIQFKQLNDNRLNNQKSIQHLSIATITNSNNNKSTNVKSINKTKTNTKGRTRNESFDEVKPQKSLNNSNRNMIKVIANARVVSQSSHIKSSIINNKNELPHISIQNSKSSSSPPPRNIIKSPKPNRNNGNYRERNTNNITQINHYSIKIKDDLDYLNEIKRQNNLFISNDTKTKPNNTNINQRNKQSITHNYKKDHLYLYSDINQSKISKSQTYNNKMTFSQNNPIDYIGNKPFTASVISDKKHSHRKLHRPGIKPKTLGVIKEEDELFQNEEIKTDSFVQYKPILPNFSSQQNDIYNNAESDINHNNNNAGTNPNNDTTLSDIETIMQLRKGYKSSFLQH